MRVILPFILNGQSLEKAKGFPKKIVSGSKDCVVLKVENVPDGVQGSAYFKLSWESGKTYTLPAVGGEVVVDEYLTTLPKNTNDYIDYVLSVSFAFNEHGEDGRLTTNPVDLVLEKTNYSNETENAPDLPEDRYEVIVRDVVYLLDTVHEIDDQLIPNLEKRVEDLENGGGGTGGGDNVLEVTYDGETCSEKASAIWYHVSENGGRVVMRCADDKMLSLVSCDEEYALFMEISDDPPFAFVEVGNNGVNTFEWRFASWDSVQNMDITLDQRWTDEQKEIARQNIGAVGSGDLENVTDYIDDELADKIGDIETALDGIIALQQTLIGGDGV